MNVSDKLGLSLGQIVEQHQQPEKKKEVCRAFQRGECTRGTACPYIHKQKKDRSVEVCRDFTLRGHCPRKGSCPYRHPKTSSSSAPSSAAVVHNSGTSTAPSLYCHDFLMGECSRGTACLYVHDEGRVETCRQYIRGECRRGGTCSFHHPHTVPSSVEAELCRDFQREEGCTRGASCPFIHLPANVEICRDFVLGDCKRGHRCPFHHLSSTATSLPSSSSSSTSTLNDGGSKRKRVHDSGAGSSSGSDASEIRRLRDENKSLREDNASLRFDNSELRAELKALQKVVYQ